MLRLPNTPQDVLITMSAHGGADPEHGSGEAHGAAAADEGHGGAAASKGHDEHGAHEHEEHEHHNWFEKGLCRKPVLLVSWLKSGDRMIVQRNQELGAERQ